MKLLLLTSSTGGGHDMRARSFQQWSEHSSAADLKIDYERIQVLETTHPLYEFGVTLYNWIQMKMPWLHHIYFSYLELAGMHLHADSIMGRDVFEDKLREIKPDVIISTHAHLNHAFFDIAKEVLGKKVRCITYCGELYGNYGFSKHWVNPRSDYFIGAVDETCSEAARIGMSKDKNWTGGFMLNPRFYEKPLSEAERREFVVKELGLDPDKFILLLATGANGANNHLDLIRAIHLESCRIQIVALCGRNEEAKKDIEAWADSHKQLPVKALSYRADMFEIMQSVSAIVARPGTGTTSESIMAACPIIFNGIGGVMPQEYITLKYAKKHGIAKLIMSADGLPRRVNELLKPKSLTEQRNRMKSLRPKTSPLDILKKITSI